MSLLLVDAEVDGRRVDLRLADGVVARVSPSLSAEPGDDVIEAGGGALLPGLHDHHLHLSSLAAALRSVRCGPPSVTDSESLGAALRRATPDAGGWVRGIGYHESVAGPLDIGVLDRLVADRPVRVQHRSGGLWVVNGAGAERLGLADVVEPGVERDADGRPTGRLWRLDGWLRQRLGADSSPDLAAVGRLLAGFGVTGVTDATPDLDAGALARLTAATADGSLPQQVQLLGAPAGWTPAGRLSVGPVKLLLHDHDLPPFDALVADVRAARRQRRAVAVHCVTREALILTLAVLDEVGAVDGDRIEHAAVAPPELVGAMVRLGVRAVTQPVFVAERGDDYLADVEPDDRPHLYRYASLLAAGVKTAPSTDAPFGDPDPWRTLAAARDRRTAAGRALGAGEAVDVATALDGLLAPLDDPGGRPRRVEAGRPADLCLLHVALADALAAPSSDLVRLTVCAGSLAAGA